jgi:hypothetical protein
VEEDADIPYSGPAQRCHSHHNNGAV